MSVNAATGGGVTAAGVAVAQAIKASGAIVEIKPEDFINLFNQQDKPLVVVSYGGFLQKLSVPGWLQRANFLYQIGTNTLTESSNTDH